nr:hypothetical protein [uncultured Rhodopila sp.]
MTIFATVPIFNEDAANCVVVCQAGVDLGEQSDRVLGRIAAPNVVQPGRDLRQIFELDTGRKLGAALLETGKMNNVVPAE